MLPHELAARHLAPRLRSLVAHRLHSLGMGQERIARLIAVSQPMVSRYLRTPLDRLLAELAELGVEEGEALAVADTLASTLLRGDRRRYLELATSYVNSLLSRGALCSLHQRHGAPVDCDICARLFQPSHDPYIEEVREAVEAFTSLSGAARLVPNVGSNIVAARPGASSVADIVGLTGGLFRAGGRVAVVGEPSYGGSSHTAKVLLAVHRRWRRIRAALVVAYRRECIEKLRRAGLHVATSGPHASPEALLDDIEDVVAALSRPPDVLADLGGSGLEPVAYILASSAPAAVQRARLCL